MKKTLGLGMLAVMLSTLLAVPVFAAPVWDRNPKAFEHGITVEYSGQGYWFAGPGSIIGKVDVPGHTWVQAGPNQVEGRHYNVGPWFLPMGTPWWATGEPYGVLLFKVHGIIAPTELDAEAEGHLKKQGYVHRHELIYADGPMMGHVAADIRVYLKHIAVRDFFFDGGPMMPMYWVHPGVDYNFMPNW